MRRRLKIGEMGLSAIWAVMPVMQLHLQAAKTPRDRPSHRAYATLETTALELPMPTPIPPGPSQESVWDYPRPPRLEPCDRQLIILFNGITLADTRYSHRILETSHPPTYYIPAENVQLQYCIPEPRQSFCEWKGVAHYYSIQVGDRRINHAAWYYPNPTPSFAPIAGAIAFYAEPMDACYVDGELVQPQPGNFYGGWVTSSIVGPFKGIPGSWGW